MEGIIPCGRPGNQWIFWPEWTVRLVKYSKNDQLERLTIDDILLFEILSFYGETRFDLQNVEGLNIQLEGDSGGFF